MNFAFLYHKLERKSVVQTPKDIYVENVKGRITQ